MRIVLLASVAAASFPSSYYYDETFKDCQPMTNFMAPYSGVRVWCEKDLSGQKPDRMALTVCQNGKTYDYTNEGSAGCTNFRQTYSFENTSSDHLWEDWKFKNGTFKVVRRHKFMDREVPVYWPETFVGGIFKCPESEPCTNENAIPFVPLLADEPWHFLRSFENFRLQVKFPLFYSPDFTHHHDPHLLKNNNWAKYLDVNERYRPPRREAANQDDQYDKYYIPPGGVYENEDVVQMAGFRDSLKEIGSKIPGKVSNRIKSVPWLSNLHIPSALKEALSSEVLKQYDPKHGALGLLYHLRVNLEYSQAKKVWLEVSKMFK